MADIFDVGPSKKTEWNLESLYGIQRIALKVTH